MWLPHALPVRNIRLLSHTFGAVWYRVLIRGRAIDRLVWLRNLAAIVTRLVGVRFCLGDRGIGRAIVSRRLWDIRRRVNGIDIVRCRFRGPSFINVASLPYLVEGQLVADLVASNASLDIVLGEIDR